MRNTCIQTFTWTDWIKIHPLKNSCEICLKKDSKFNTEFRKFLSKGTKRNADADFDPGSAKSRSGADAPIRTSSRARTAPKAFDLSGKSLFYPDCEFSCFPFYSLILSCHWFHCTPFVAVRLSSGP